MSGRGMAGAIMPERSIAFPARCDEAPRRAHLAVDGGDIEVATWGPAPAEAPSLILLHEGLGCVDLWRDFPARLARATGRGIVAYSRLGYGRSSPVTPPLPLDRMAREAERVLPRLIDALAPRQFALIGHSDGATIAAHYLAGSPDPRLERAVLIAPHFFVEASNLAAIRATRDAFETGDLRHRLARYHGPNVDGAFYGFAETWLAPAFRDWDMRADIARWRHPVLFLQGNDDPYGSPAQAQAAAASPLSRITNLDACAHAPHLEQPDVTMSLITAFLAKGAAP